ncbi:PREDICTED: neutral and basic amino acid transport protein rBAT-like [Priapulus caudatus]|uniref:alpha-glucosidase n=1 Tax=Priapulus caudatus TaxID=37621 RepID=A0ABM1DPI0_PRICU|nr:PREDICTED: neutral and basic amino acid transport protein rBAT-like [Priapulus caudatus]
METTVERRNEEDEYPEEERKPGDITPETASPAESLGKTSPKGSLQGKEAGMHDVEVKFMQKSGSNGEVTLENIIPFNVRLDFEDVRNLKSSLYHTTTVERRNEEDEYPEEERKPGDITPETASPAESLGKTSPKESLRVWHDRSDNSHGLESRLDYLSDDLAVDAIYLDSLYDGETSSSLSVVDHAKIAPIYGHVTDFERIIEKAHAKGLRVLLDFIPTHTSYRHAWFQAALERDAKYSNYYVWTEREVRGAAAAREWQTDAKRGDRYHYTFNKYLPDLNLGNANVQQEMVGILRYWLDKGVDGFIVRNPRYIRDLTDLGISTTTTTDTYQQTAYTLVKSWAKILDEYTKKTPRERILIVEGGNDTQKDAMFLRASVKASAGASVGASAVLYKQLVTSLTYDCRATCIVDAVHHWQRHTVAAAVRVGWQLSDSSHDRAAKKLGKEYANALNMLLLLLPGGAVTYYGEEIAMDGRTRAPMHWENARPGGGFTNVSRSWLPLGDLKRNVKEQLHDKESQMGIYKQLCALRKDPAFHTANITVGHVKDTSLLYFARVPKDGASYLVVINLGETRASLDGEVKANGPVVLHTGQFKIGQKLSTASLALDSGQGVVIRM